MKVKKQFKQYDTATISGKTFCKDCGWPVVDVCCNDEFQNYKDAKLLS